MPKNKKRAIKKRAIKKHAIKKLEGFRKRLEVVSPERSDFSNSADIYSDSFSWQL